MKGKALGCKVLRGLATIVTPDTILRWHRELVAKKWDYSGRRGKVGRSRTKQEIAELIVRIANGNPTWGYDRIEGALQNLGITLCDTKVVLLPPKSPNLNANIERFMRSMKSECLRKLIFFGEASLRRAFTEFSSHYHEERNHQGLDNNIIQPSSEVGRIKGNIQHRERLGGMLSYYFRNAA